MTLPEGFTFSQSNLQDYLDCQRRFQLRYLLHIAWPALQTQPASDNEQYLQLGAAFHHLIRQHQTGIPVNLLSATIQHYQDMGQNELASWWENYLTALDEPEDLGILLQPSPPLTIEVFPEISLAASLGGFRLVAKYDLLAICSSGALTIVDWKTNRTRPPRQWLQGRMQSRIYPYVLAKSGTDLIGPESIQPENVVMCYWFANFPAQSEQFIYSPEQFSNDEEYLLDLINQINRKSDVDFPLTHNELICRFCIYRSLCDRGTQAPPFHGSESEHSDTDYGLSDINMEQIDEIEY